VPTNQQRREAERRRLQHQLEERRAREATRKRRTLILSIAGTVVLIAGIVVVVIIATNNSGGGSGQPGNAAGAQQTPANAQQTPTPTTSSPAAPLPTPTKPCSPPPKGTTATFQGVTVSGAKDLQHAPKVKSLSEHAPTTVQCMDVVVGKGKPATPTSTVKVQYAGSLYQNGAAFDSSWSRGGKPASFPLTGVIPGFTQGIGGAGKVAPMREGGRRIMILPAALAYAGNPPQGSNIPVNAPLVFVVDLKSVS
jgi:peptidylprolyl isomerase